MLIIINDTPRPGVYLRAVLRMSSRPLLLIAGTLLALPPLLFLALAQLARSSAALIGSRGFWLWMAALTPVLLLAVLALAVAGSVWHQFRKAPQLNEPRTLVLSDEGIVVIGRTYAVRSRWSDIESGEAGGGVLLLRARQGAVHVLALSAIAEAQRQNLFELLRSRLAGRFR